MRAPAQHFCPGNVRGSTLRNWHVRFLVIALGLLIVGSAGSAHSQCVTGTLTAEFITVGPFAGYYKYTLSFSWNTQQGLSNLTLDCGFGECAGDACAADWLFDDPAGDSTNDPEPGVCNGTTLYTGEFNCGGNPSIGVTDPIIKWDVVPGECEPETAGSGTLCFYSPAAPQSGEATMILVKNGQNVCEGTVMGDCPGVCPVPTDIQTWGAIKAKHK
jgi:hypothetical protein